MTWLRSGNELANTPNILFLCVHNAGRSQMAAGFARDIGGDRIKVWSGGSEPATQVNNVAIQVMLEIGIDISTNTPAKWTDADIAQADVVITMGCGDTCPFVPGKHYEDWKLDDPAGQTIDVVRLIREEIRHRVEKLISRYDDKE